MLEDGTRIDLGVDGDPNDIETDAHGNIISHIIGDDLGGRDGPGTTGVRNSLT